MVFDFAYQIRNRTPADQSFNDQHESNDHKKEFSHSEQYRDTE
jgi:hypothetical protein